MTNGLGSQSGLNRRRISIATAIVATALSIYWVTLFYGTHMKLPPGVLPGHSDKLVHFCAYAALAVLLMSLRFTRGGYSWFGVICRWLILAAYGVFDEQTQKLIHRTADLHDWYADLLGAAFGLAAVIFLVWCFRRSPKRTDISPQVTDGVPG